MCTIKEEINKELDKLMAECKIKEAIKDILSKLSPNATNVVIKAYGHGIENPDLDKVLNSLNCQTATQLYKQASRTLKQEEKKNAKK